MSFDNSTQHQVTMNNKLGRLFPAVSERFGLETIPISLPGWHKMSACIGFGITLQIDR